MDLIKKDPDVDVAAPQLRDHACRFVILLQRLPQAGVRSLVTCGSCRSSADSLVSLLCFV